MSEDPLNGHDQEEDDQEGKLDQEGDRAGASRPDTCESVASEGGVGSGLAEEGGGVRKVLRAPGQIKDAYESGIVPIEVLAQNILDGLAAEKVIVMKHSRGSGKDRETWEEIKMVPDMEERRRWQDHLVQTVEGMPIKRQQIITKKMTSKEDLMQMVEDSPQFARSLKKVIEEIEARPKKGGGKSTDAEADEHSD